MQPLFLSNDGKVLLQIDKEMKHQVDILKLQEDFILQREEYLRQREEFVFQKQYFLENREDFIIHIDASRKQRAGFI